MKGWRTAGACCLVAGATFLLYRATLLPGGDLGDTASFQAIAGSRVITPRQGYPLYFGLTNLLLWTSRAEPAYSMNLASALAAALACGVLVWVAEALTGSLLAALITSLLFASSYTFWSQSVIAEVYALHILMMALSLATLLWWSRAPSLRRLAPFFGIYALGFSNHLMMILLLPSFAIYLALCMPRGARQLVEPRVLALATGMAALGALPYLWNFSYLWYLPSGTLTMIDRVDAFWFDITKTDWRETMVWGIPRTALADRAAMYWFDLRQQFGLPGVMIAGVGTIWFAARRRTAAALLITLLVVTTVFAFTYNVGDTHVFYLPSHVVVALLAGGGVAMLGEALSTWVRRSTGPAEAGPHENRSVFMGSGFGRIAGATIPCVLTLALLAYPVFRIVDTYPAVDRSRDRRAVQYFDTLTRPLDGSTTILGVDLNWQLENGLAYYARHVRPAVTWFHARSALPYFPKLVAWNREIDRDVAVTAAVRQTLALMYGPLLEFVPDTRNTVSGLVEQVDGLTPATPYALALLSPDSERSVDRGELSRVLFHLTGQHIEWDARRPYHVVVGAIGEPPVLVKSAMRPFRAAVRVNGLPVDVRMESWLPTETFRRAGFGHIIVGGRHALTLERGVSFGAFTASGDAAFVTAYRFGLYAPQTRYIVRVAIRPS